ncbi:MAG: 2-oxoglutarate dehydrogenase complex dihydrolipoyllysine-residue succinyltransferase [Haliscomenobacter sp.]|nr:2-oxoglutarate dehydrogenase complex dihydrolipoyllysine-residue succinyltransferase [Haliscomenobacter sp.]MBK9488050.1 2-oxoglutarate dehydrogenase complex dihydrolipoyllysine-residue succinyltransferase [Haliscomenobacter sp.]
MSVVELRVPSVGESINEVTLSRWLKEDGSFVKLDESLCEFESDKATLEFPSEATGKLIHVAKEGDDLAIGALVAKIDTSVSAGESAPSTPPAETPASTPAVSKPAEPAPSATSNYATGHPSPAAGKILKENDIPATAVAGTGRDGRITKDDAVKAVENKVATPAAKVEAPAVKVEAPAATPAAAPKAKDVPAFSRDTERKKMTRMRRTIAKRLVSAKNETAMLTTFNEVDLTELMALREKYQDKFVAKYGIKLGFMSLFAKACAKILLQMPEVNAMIDGEDFVYHNYADISFAISTPNGLVVPPIRNVESLSFAEVEVELKNLAGKARNGTLTLEEMSGGTFTITNGGVFGSLLSTPIINEPQSAILGMHAIKNRPIAVGDKVEIRPMMYLALSYDHRVIDGSSSVTFLVKVKELLEDPIAMLLDI